MNEVASEVADGGSSSASKHKAEDRDVTGRVDGLGGADEAFEALESDHCAGGGGVDKGGEVADAERVDGIEDARRTKGVESFSFAASNTDTAAAAAAACDEKSGAPAPSGARACLLYTSPSPRD